MKRLTTVILSIAIAATAISAPISTVRLYNGVFLWVHLGQISPNAVKSFLHAKTFVLTVTFSKPAKLKKDAHGHAWLSFILSDQLADDQWHQTTGSVSVPTRNGIVVPGTYKLKLPVAGIPRPVLVQKWQTMNAGVSTSGLYGKTDFTVDDLKGQ